MGFWGALEETVVDGAGAAIGAVPYGEPIAAGIHAADGAAHSIAGAYDAWTGDDEGAAEQMGHTSMQMGEAATSLIPLYGALQDAATMGFNATATGARAAGASDEEAPTTGDLYNRGLEHLAGS